MRKQCECATAKPVSLAIMPKSATWLYRRSSSSRTTRRWRARSGTAVAEAASSAWQYASAWPIVVSPDTRSASSTPPSGARPSKSFSVPLCVKYRRDFMSMTVSPTTLKRKWPGSMTPACTGPTGIS